MRQAEIRALLSVYLHFNSEDGGDMFFRNVSRLPPVYMSLYPYEAIFSASESHNYGSKQREL
jgi:hypothetical protein